MSVDVRSVPLAAIVPRGSIVDFAQKLIRIPSQAGIDPRQPVLNAIADWLSAHGLEPQLLRDSDNAEVAVLAELNGDPSGPTFCLNACADTAPIGAVEAWRYPPFSARVDGGWLYGRGSADSKIAEAIFLHLAEHLAPVARSLQGTLSFLFDADEHTGGFGGIRAYLERRPNVAGVMVGYPGNYGVIVGARGFYRVQIRVYGNAAHSGTRKKGITNAAEKAADLITKFASCELVPSSDPDFEFGPKLTVTAINGGSGFSTVPGSCDVNVDVRLTRTFDSASAGDLVSRIVTENHRAFPSPRANAILSKETIPAYRLSNDSHIARALRAGASQAMARDVPAVVCGPSNAGNLFAKAGVDATCGFGVTYKSIHGVDECIEVESIDMAYRAYLYAVHTLLFTS